MPISDYITTLSVTLDSDLTLNKHVGKLAYYYRYSSYLASGQYLHLIWPDRAVAASLSSLTQTHLDFANSVYLSELLEAILINFNASKTAFARVDKAITIQLPLAFVNVTELH